MSPAALSSPRFIGVLVAFAGAACGQAATEAAEAPSSPDAPAAPGSDPAAPSGKRAPCTLGADQTCNADPAVSALWGRCTELGVCECQDGFELNPSGRCQPGQ
jgi:hypothetical protein